MAAPSFNPSFNRPRMKPQIYKTIDGMLIVQDEFLNFLAVKIKTMCQDELVILASKHFDSQWIESSRKVLFELCPNTKQRFVAFKGHQKDVNNIKSCLKVLNECGENIPHFVSHFLDELPPVTFNSMDVSNLLSKMERLHSEICALRQAVKLQADVGEDLRTVTSTIDRRVAVMERHMVSHGGIQPGVDMSATRISSTGVHVTAEAGETPGEQAMPSGSQVTTGFELPTDDATQEGCTENVEVAAVNKNTEGTVAPINSPKWSLVVKQGQRMKDESHSARIKQRTNKSERKRPEPIHGTGTQSHIRAVRTKLVNVFATKFLPDLDAEELRSYLKEKLGRDVQCERIVTGNTRCSSFKVSIECEDVSEVYNPELWPEGSLVRRYYESRKMTHKAAAVTTVAHSATGSAGAVAALSH